MQINWNKLDHVIALHIYANYNYKQTITNKTTVHVGAYKSSRVRRRSIIDIFRKLLIKSRRVENTVVTYAYDLIKIDVRIFRICNDVRQGYEQLPRAKQKHIAIATVQSTVYDQMMRI